MKKIYPLILIGLFFTFSSAAQGDEYEEKLKLFFKASGSEASFKVAISQTITLIKGQYPDITNELWDRIGKEFQETSLDELVTMLVPVYSRHLTSEDLDEIIAFYQTPAGMKYAQKTPFIMQESMQVGGQWGLKIGNDLVEKLNEEGY